MIGSGGGGGTDISKYLINFNSSDWANQANSYLQSALTSGTNYAQQYNQAGIDATQAFQNQANQAQQSGYQMAQAVQAPQRLAAYGALDAYQDSLGLARPTEGSFQLASSLENAAKQQQGGLFQQQQMSPQQTQMAGGFNQGLLGPVQRGV